MSVDFPEPVEPINAVVSPGLEMKFISLRTYSAASEYLNETFLNSTVPE